MKEQIRNMFCERKEKVKSALKEELILAFSFIWIDTIALMKQNSTGYN